MKTYLIKIRQARSTPFTLCVIAKTSIDALATGINLIRQGESSSICVTCITAKELPCAA